MNPDSSSNNNKVKRLTNKQETFALNISKPGYDTWKNDEGEENEYSSGIIYHPPPKRDDDPPLPVVRGDSSTVME